MARPTTLLLISILVAANPADAQLRVSGQADLLARNQSDARGLNRNFRSDSPFNELRVKLFGQHWLNDRVGVFTEFLFDNEADVRINGAYVVITELAGREGLNLRAGLAPSIVGSFGLRSTYFNANPLVGVPLVWQHRTTLDGSGLFTHEDLVRRKASDAIGLPMIYEACWNLQWELMGHRGIFEYSIGVTSGSLSNPGGARASEGVQMLGRVGVEPALGLRFGVSGAVGPYIGGRTRDSGIEATTFPGSPGDYDQVLYGYDVEIARGKAQLVSEGFVSTWEAPLVQEPLRATGGYIEGRYDLWTRWIAAARLGAMVFSDISSTSDGAGPRTGWDDDVIRSELALTYRWSREVHMRLGWQHTHFTTGPGPSQNLMALQLRTVF